MSSVIVYLENYFWFTTFDDTIPQKMHMDYISSICYFSSHIASYIGTQVWSWNILTLS